MGSETPHSALGEEIVRLGGALSPAGIAVAASFLAYLVGSFSQSLFEGLGGQVGERIGWTGLLRLSRRGLEVLDDLLVTHYLSGALEGRIEAGHLGNAIIEDLHLVKTRLRDSSPGLYEEIDRLHGEAELRFALLPPLAALAVVAILALPAPGLAPIAAVPEELFLKALTWGVLALTLLWLITVQAIAVSRQANDKILDALLLEKVSAPAMDRWEREAAKA